MALGCIHLVAPKPPCGKHALYPPTQPSPLGPWCVYCVSIPSCGMGIKRWEDNDLVSRVMRASESMYEWIVWPIERFLWQRRGHVQFWKRNR